MEKTIGMRIKECRVKMGMTQDELAERLLTKKSTVSAYENDKIDIKISILKQVAKELDTTVFYLVGEQDEDISNEVMQMAMVLQQIQSRKLRMAAIEQVKVLAAMTVANKQDAVLKAKINFIIEEIERCQKANGGKWACSIPEKYFAKLEKNEYIWSPQYTVHKLIMGLTISS